MYDNFYSNEKEKSIYAYIPNPIERRGNTYKFADYISKKYNCIVVTLFKPTFPFTLLHFFHAFLREK